MTMLPLTVNMASSNAISSTSSTDYRLKIISYNMFGFNQGSITVTDMIEDLSPDIFMLQEHWLTPANLSNFDIYNKKYFTFGSSAMHSAVESGMLRGRPAGGIMMMISNKLRKCTQTIFCAERFCIVKVADCIFVNVYFPCVGTHDRLLIIDDMIAQISSYFDDYATYDFFIAGDFNIDLDDSSNVSVCYSNFMSKYQLHRCDKILNKAKAATFVGKNNSHATTIDYMLISSTCHFVDFEVFDPDINFSDHLPIIATYCCNISSKACCGKQASRAENVKYLRWDHADQISYYHFTGLGLQAVLCELNNAIALWNANSDSIDYVSCIDKLYNDTVNVLVATAKLYVPQRSKSFHKFWWDEFKLLNTGNLDIVQECLSCCGFSTVSERLSCRTASFVKRR